MSQEKVDPSRPEIHKNPTVAAPAAAVTHPPATLTPEPAEVEDAGGYRETEHVKKYLASARF
jgi:hypothetical protein